jgi:uncharacterized protein (TIGR03067 family)
MIAAHRLLLALWIALAPSDDPSPTVRDELARHQGAWIVLASVRDGEEADPETIATIRRVVERDHVHWERDGKRFAGTTLVLDPTCDPPSIDLIPDGGQARGQHVLGIYRLDGDTLTTCIADAGRPRPTEFAAGPGSKQTLMTFRRAQPRDRNPDKSDGPDR